MVVLQSHEWLGEAFQQRSAAIAKTAIEDRMNVSSGVRIQEDIYPVKLPQGPVRALGAGAGYESVRSLRPDPYLVAVEFEDESAADEFSETNEDVEGMFSDPEIGLCPVVDPSGPVGATADVEAKLDLAALHAAGGDGHGVKVMVVDNGIDGAQINVVGGFSPVPGIAPGTAAADHGTMVAFDTLIAAPRAMVHDYALLKSTGSGWVGFLSDAVRAFSEIMIDHLQVPGPMVAVNSWAMYNRSQDAPAGNPQNYSRNPNHPFNQITGALVGTGVDVLFAAGNCGGDCPDLRCGSGDRGPGNSIHGANSHPQVFSVAAVTIHDDRLCYSSQGPGGLNVQAPDISGFSHFAGSGVTPQDSGTSAACPVVAGVVAAIRSIPRGRNLTPAEIKTLLTDNARNVHGGGWSADFGWGIVDADAAFNALP
jgi:subtilisin family serine protease